jgi:ribose 5-phosphate isomerase RpiB
MKDMPPNSTTVLCWPKRLLSADDLRRHLTSQRELLLLPRTVVTPLAADELRAKGVRISWQTAPVKETVTPMPGTWIYAQEKHDATIVSAITALQREGITLTPFQISGTPISWARTFAETILAGHPGGIALCGDAATVCCIANKIAGMRGAAVMNVPQVVRAKRNLGANLFAIEVPGPTFFQVRQMIQTIVTGTTGCPDDIAKVLKELDGHAHR